MSGLWSDIKFGFRMVAMNPGFSIVAVLVLALGIGASTAIFSIVYCVVLSPLPFPDPDRLVSIWMVDSKTGERGGVDAANHQDWLAQNGVFDKIALVRGMARFNLTGEGEPEYLHGVRISANLLPALHAQPILGRSFTDDEDEIGNDKVVILSHSLWQRRFGGNPNVVGQVIQLNHAPHTIVGVMGPAFQYPDRTIQIWAPLTINPRDFQTRTGFQHFCVARLKTETTIQQAQKEMDAISARLAQQYPDTNKDIRVTVVPLRDDITGTARTPLFVLLGAVSCLLLIGCANVANLFLSRTVVRSREMNIRAALGASHAGLIRHAFAEMIPIFVLGGILGMLLAIWSIDLMVPLLPESLPRASEIHINVPVLLFACGILSVTSVLTGLLPAFQVMRVNLVKGLRDDVRTSSGGTGQTKTRASLVVAEFALTTVLLACAILLIRSFTELNAIDPGFRADRVLSLQMAVPRSKYTSDRAIAVFYQQVLEEVQNIPGVESAGMVKRLPLGGIQDEYLLEFEGTDARERGIKADGLITTPGYFQSMGIPLIAGRAFTEQDAEDAPQVVIVDEKIARLISPNQNPIGKRVRSGGPGNAWAEIVGVVGHVRQSSIEEDVRPQIYWNYHQYTHDRMALVVRTRTEPDSSRVIAAIHSIDPDQSVYSVLPMSNVVERSLSQQRFNMVLLSIFASASLLLACLGIYGVISYSVKQRVREIGVRMAMGANRFDILKLVLMRGIGLAVGGLLPGVLGAFVAARFMQSLLFHVSITDGISFALTAALLLMVALLASYLPARSASMVDPMTLLRHE